jgi:hypothetical protein
VRSGSDDGKIGSGSGRTTLVEYLALELEKVLPHGAVEKERLQLQPPGGQRGQRLLADTTHINLNSVADPDPVLF